MEYECPKCGSTEKPRTIIYFSPAIVQCKRCLHKDNLSNFVKKQLYHLTALPRAPSYPDSL